MGLSFSVPRGVRLPPSLRNIYQELTSDVGFKDPGHGDLTHWAEQGVFLLNAMLTVEKNKPSSHSSAGWQDFTDAVIRKLSAGREQLVFMLWGAFAQKKATMIDGNKHLVLTSPHPSPFSAHKGFFGNRHFSQANAYLQSQSKTPINWQL
jgi:uracil-DNA glycosylase